MRNSLVIFGNIIYKIHHNKNIGNKPSVRTWKLYVINTCFHAFRNRSNRASSFIIFWRLLKKTLRQFRMITIHHVPFIKSNNSEMIKHIVCKRHSSGSEQCPARLPFREHKEYTASDEESKPFYQHPKMAQWPEQ